MTGSATPRIEAQRDQLVLDFAHIVVAERQRRKSRIGLLLRRRLRGERRTLLSRAALVGALRARSGRQISGAAVAMPAQKERWRDCVNMAGYLAQETARAVPEFPT